MAEFKKKKRAYAYGLDILRIICTIAVLVYHINPDLIPGGFLAVCCFLVLHGYLFVISNSTKEHFSVIDYYVKRLFRLYLPMAIVVFATLYVVSFFPDLMWLNKKPESVSVLLGYNNWWQISAGQSYFARVTNSPFTHMWYMALLLQAELLIPLIYRLFRLATRYIKFIFIWILFMIMTVLSMRVIPDLIKASAPEMRIYFGTDARIFSIFLGMALGLWRSYNKKRLTFNFMRIRFVGEVLFVLELGVLVYLFFTVNETHKYYNYSFIIVSLLTLLIINTVNNRSANVFKTLSQPFIRIIASISYEVYLIHYPVMFIFTLIGGMEGIRMLYYLLTVIGCSILLHFALGIRIRPFKWPTVLKLALCAAMVYPTFLGVVQFIQAKDYTQDMADLEAQLNKSAELQEQLQQEFLEKRNAERELLSDPTKMIEDVDAKNLPVTGIGDSVMLGAVATLYNTFPNGEFDAKQNRSHYPVIDILQSKVNNGTLGNPVVIGIGTNGPVPQSAFDQMVSLCGDRYVYFLTTTNNWQFANRDNIWATGRKYPNVTIIDWESYSANHNEYFYYDGIHLTPEGRVGYANYILDCIAKDLVVRKYKLDEDHSVMGIGDGYLLTSVDYLKEQLEEPYIIAREELNWDDVFADIEKLVANDSLPARIFINVGNVKTISQMNLERLFTLIKERPVFIIKTPMNKGNSTNNNIDIVAPEFENVTVLDWSDMKKEHPEYFAFDRKHLTVEGSKALANYILEILNQ
ncbi:MAG: acyltransferase [Erysipelotrichaceae bacterium]|nr:acyltransferase [Erysipelotrichaceae bacterium]